MALSPYLPVFRPLRLFRATGTVAGLLAAALRESWPDDATESVAWIALAVVAAGSLGIWGWARGTRSPRDLNRVGALGFLLDMTLIFGMVWAFLPPYWFLIAALPFVPVSGALRYRWVGTWLGSVATGIFSVFEFIRIADLTGATFDRTGFAAVVLSSTAIACVVAAMTENWHVRLSEFEQQAARLVELDRMKDRYIAVTSHEIRGPLSAMVAAIDTVQARWDQLEPARRDHLLNMVQLQGRELDRLVQDLFISAEVQSGGLQLHPEWTELESMVKRATEAAAGKRRGHLLELFVDPLRVEIDPYRVTQVIRNLVENAYKYTDERTKVVVSARGMPDGIQLEVSDNGPGIPAEKRSQLFEAFSRIEETTAGREGVGLGLYVVSQLVAAMDGRIDLQSSSRGTTFSIHIPCRKMPVDQPQIGLVGGDEAIPG